MLSRGLYAAGQHDLLEALTGRVGNDEPVTTAVAVEMELPFSLYCLGQSLMTAGALEMQRRYGQWDLRCDPRGLPSLTRWESFYSGH